MEEEQTRPDEDDMMCRPPELLSHGERLRRLEANVDLLFAALRSIEREIREKPNVDSN